MNHTTHLKFLDIHGTQQTAGLVAITAEVQITFRCRVLVKYTVERELSWISDPRFDLKKFKELQTKNPLLIPASWQNTQVSKERA